ncbi:MAG: hypothetical protein M3131_07825 [Actinomycetota bacterium]|nr:hypothetical protein [Actinomycetota bacterium]
MRPHSSFAFVLAALFPLFPAPQPKPPPAQPPTSTTPATPAPSAPLPDTRLAGRPRGPLIGLSDNRPETIVDPRFRRSGIKRIRVLVPFDDVARGGWRRRTQDAWFDTARANGIEPLVSFYRSYRSKKLLPSVSQYRYHFRRFRARYPWVRLFSTWNEANFPDAQPTGNFPRRTAQFYKVARQECSAGRCTVLAADFRADGGAHSARWLRTFKRHIGRGRHIWGLVSHPDVNRLSTARTRQFLRATRGDVWATEVGAVNFFGRGFRPNISRQTRAMRFLMYRYPNVSRRLKRMYIYHWRAARGDRLWDSALLSASGKRRPSYYIFFRGLGKPAP